VYKIKQISNCHEIEHKISTGFNIIYKTRNIIIKTDSKEESRQWVYCINAVLFGSVDKLFNQHYEAQNASLEVRKRRQSILCMTIASDSEHSDFAIETNKEKTKDKYIGRSRIHIIKSRISELNDDLARLKQNKIDFRLKLANLVEHVKPDHLRFTLSHVNANKINKLFGRSF